MDNLEILFSNKDFANTSVIYSDRITNIKVTDNKTLDFTKPVIIAGPCAIESKTQLDEIAWNHNGWIL